MDDQVQGLYMVEELLNNKKHKYFEVKSGYTLATNDSLHRLSATLQRDRKLQAAIQAGLLGTLKGVYRVSIGAL